MHAGEGDAGSWFGFGRAALIASAAVIEGERSVAGGSEPVDTTGEDDELRRFGVSFRDSLAGDDLFAVIAANAGLDAGEAAVLAICAAAAADRSCRELVGALHGDGNRGGLSLGLLADISRQVRRVVEGVAPDVLAVRRDGAPVRSCLIEVDADGPWTDHRVRLHPSVVWALIGDDSRDVDLPDDATIFDLDQSAFGADEAGRRHDFVVVNGPDRLRRRTVGASSSFGRRFLCAKAPDSERAWSALVREATLSGCGVIIEVDQALAPVGRPFIERATHLGWVLSSPSGPSIEDMPRRSWLDVYAVGTDPSDEEWDRVFGPGVPRTHRLTMDQLHRVGRAFRVDDDAQEALDRAVRRLTSGDLERLTTRRRPTRTWDDVIVSEDRRRLLVDIVERYRHDHRVFDDWQFEPNPSRGLVALFSGPSGTGKTLAAEIVAGELGLDLFKLDLSSVVSKYIGETERNLEQIFDAASAGNVVLFFDEADSLFGKRSEVRDARDRYANIEVSYLLQRLETYDGLVVMATNFEKNVDEAFLRRIHVRVPFAMPGPDERRQIWERNLPSFAPIGDVDLDWLSERFELSGASIRNAAVQGAFLAARGADPVIGTDHLVLGVVHELRKVGRLVTASDFGEYAKLLSE